MTRSPARLQDKVLQALRLRLALKLVWQSSRGWTITRLILLVLQSTLPLISLYLMKLIIDTVTTSLTVTGNTTVLKPIFLLIGITGGINLVNVAFNAIAELVSTTQAQIITNYMYGILHAKAIEVDLEYYENADYYDTLQRARQEAYYRPTRILNNLMQFGQSSISLLGILGLLVWFHWGLAIVLFLSTLPGVFVRLRYTSKMYYWKRQRTSTERYSMYLDLMLTSNEYAKEIRLFNLGHLFSHRFNKLRQQLYRESLVLATKKAFERFMSKISSNLAIYGSYAFIAYQTVQGTFSLGDLVMYYQAFQRGEKALTGLWKSISDLYEDNLFLINLYEFLDITPKVAQPSNPEQIPQLQHKGIQFHQVSFEYPNTQRKGLQDINLTIHPGEVIALVGENGAGKTTLVKLLCRLYDPTAGKITFEGIALQDFTTSDLRRQISVVFQDYAKYQLIARENIWVGNIDLPLNDPQIDMAAKKSGADAVITRLPFAYDTQLGNWFEEGEELSIGQWQKIALARAFLRDAQLVVLDEPTSALDAKAEAEVFEKFRHLLQGQSAILISHRLSTVKMADRIYVLEYGKIIESGTHEELLQLKGKYAHLFTIQAESYQ